MRSDDSNNARPGKRNFFRRSLRFLGYVVGLLVIYSAVCEVSGYIEQRNLPKPIIPVPKWKEYGYNDPMNPFAHYEIAVRMAASEDVEAVEASIRLDHPSPQAFSALSRLRPAFEEIHKGASLPAANLVFPDPTFRDALGLTATESSSRRIIAVWRALCADSQAKILSGKEEEGISELLDGIVLGSHIMRSCELLPACQGSAVSSMSSRRLLQLVVEGKVRPQSFRMIAKRLEAADSSIPSNTDLAQGLYMEQRRTLSRMLWGNDVWDEPFPVLQKPTGRSKEYDMPESDPTTTWWDDTRMRVEGFFSGITEACWNQVYVSAPGAKTTAIRRFDAIWKTEFEAVKKPYSEAILFDPRKSIPSHDDINQVLSVDTKYLRNTTENRAIVEGLMLDSAVQAFRAEKHRYPATLQDLVGVYLKKLPSDPYTDGKPFFYRKTAHSYKLYSVGPNGKDDGGTMADRVHALSWFSEEDFVFSY